MKRGRQYWCFRIDTSDIDFFKSELEQGRLRQGWGYDEGQNLKKLTVDEGASKNKAMLNVKAGDLLLVPRLPSWEKVAVVEATEDWDSGYRFDIPADKGDYGHIFPVKKITTFVRNSEYVSANIRATLRTPSRFWSINQYADDVESITLVAENELQSVVSNESKTDNAIENAFSAVFDEKAFSKALYEKMKFAVSAAEWEDALVHGLRSLLPFYQIEKVGGRTEVYHGSDILMRMPDVTGENAYLVAIQVKDFSGTVDSASVLEQINKADDYWSHQENLKLIEKIVIITKAHREDNLKLVEEAAKNSVKVIFAEELQKLLCQIGKSYLGLVDTH